MTIIERLRNNDRAPEIETVAAEEKVAPESIRAGLLDGTIIIPKNKKRKLKRLVGVGRGLKTKVNANIGTSPDQKSIEKEQEKLGAAIAAGADAVMDLSTGGNLAAIRKMVLTRCPVPVGTVPIYQTACETVGKGKSIIQMDPEHMFSVIE
jgi:phosphomethylpyrimidine synthase